MIAGLGIDIIEVKRIRRAVERYGARFLKRVYSPSEVKYCEAQRRSAEHFAARFAAKEAVLKALGTGARLGLSLSDVEIIHGEMSRPCVRLHGPALERARELGVEAVYVSLSHIGSTAVACAAAERHSPRAGTRGA